MASMEIVNYPERNYDQVGASGNCPHCAAKSYLRPVASYGEGAKLVSIARCESCKLFILIVGRKNNPTQSAVVEINVYPLGKPDETVDKSVPESVADDFKEALRCYFIKAYKATAVMCRRAIQTSALELTASGNRLIDQIDNLAEKGKITEPLKDFAHEVRLTGNDGAHPDKDGLSNITEKDAKDIVEFTQEYLHHVYVMPAKLKARRSSDQPPSST
jgi:hypothetical protein